MRAFGLNREHITDKYLTSVNFCSKMYGVKSYILPKGENYGRKK